MVHIESALHALLSELASLPATAAEWDSLPDWNRASIALDWAHLMADYLPELRRCSEDGSMTTEQCVRYRELLRELKAALPTIERLGLYRPPVPLDG